MLTMQVLMCSYVTNTNTNSPKGGKGFSTLFTVFTQHRIIVRISIYQSINSFKVLNHPPPPLLILGETLYILLLFISSPSVFFLTGQVLEQVSPKPHEVLTLTAQSLPEKNRSMEFLPSEL